MHIEEHNHCFMHFLASKHCLRRFFTSSMENGDGTRYYYYCWTACGHAGSATSSPDLYGTLRDSPNAAASGNSTAVEWAERPQPFFFFLWPSASPLGLRPRNPVSLKAGKKASQTVF